MTPALRLLDDVSWRGSPLAGDRPAALLAALALSPGGVSASGLIDAVWADESELPANPHKALQVLVSRVRAQCGPDVVVRHAGGYRLGLGTDEVDALLLRSLVAHARERLGSGDPEQAAQLARQALGLAPTDRQGNEGPLEQLRAAARRTDREAERLLGLALVSSGREREGLDLLVSVNARGNDSPEVLAALLRAEASVKGVPAALDRYEAYRSDLRERLGVDPDGSLQRVHKELLAADQPVRTGVRFETEELLGRDADLAQLRSAVRSGRLTSIIGPGGIGKTRIAHVLAREAAQTRVHFVELVGVTTSEDVVAEVGAALGVRGSVTGRGAHHTDVRGRIARELDAVPTLLVLDNCEHVVDAVAALVAFLLVTARDLRVVTTSRAPLNIAAERVVLLGQLDAADGAALFVRRARAARPAAELDHGVVTEVVTRLDGLPLAIELAAARIRAMSLEELRARLADRFALLRGKDRSAPARHQTLTAVIAWSWDLLGAEEQRALAWLARFHDGFGSSAAESVLGPGAEDLVESLVDQSLLAVVESGGVVRYRMLETVREFGMLQLADRGETAGSLTAQTAWALQLSDRLGAKLISADQVEGIDELSREENNLADLLRRALVDDEPAVMVRLLATLGMYWTITGNHPRVFALAEGVERLLRRWDPPPELVPATQSCLAVILTHLGALQDRSLNALVATMRRLGAPSDPWARTTYAMFVEAADECSRGSALRALTGHPDPATALMALQWSAMIAENEGDLETAGRHAERALDSAGANSTPWQLASLETHLWMLAMQRGDHRAANRHAEVAWPLLVSVHAFDDAVQVRAGMAMSALMDGDFAGAEQILDELGQLRRGPSLGGQMVEMAARAEVALGRGEVVAGLELFTSAVEAMRNVKLVGVEPSGYEPWTLVGEAVALMAHARHRSALVDAGRLDLLADAVLDKARSMLSLPPANLDYPVVGMSLASIGRWLLDLEPPTHQDEALRLLALADRFSYNRTFPVMAWAPLVEAAEDAVPGGLGVVQAEYAGRPGHDLLDELKELLQRVAALRRDR